MIKYIIDSYAWIEYFEGSRKGEKVKVILEKNECFTSSLSVAEVAVKFIKNSKNASEPCAIISNLSKELAVDHGIAFSAATLYVEKRKSIKDIGIVDVIIIAQARENNLVILTGDEHFKDEPNTLLI